MRCSTRNVVGVLVMVVVVLCTAFSVSGQTTGGSICAAGEFLRITEEGLVCDKAISELQRVLNEAVCKEGEYLRLSQQNNVYQLQCFSFSSAATVDESRLLPETACNVGQFVQFNAQGTAVCTSLTLTAGSQGPRGDRGDTGDAGDPGQHDHLNQYIGDHSDHAIQGGECPAGEIATGVSSTGQVTCTAQSQACSITVNTAKIDPRGYRINRPNSRTLNTGTFFTFTDCPTSGRSFTLGTPAAVPGRGGIAEFTSSPTSVSPSGTFTFSGTKNGVASIPVTAKAGQASATATFQVTVGQFTQGCTIAKKGTVPTQNITVDETKTIDFSNYFTLTNCPATVVYEVIDIDAEGYLTATPTGKTKASSKTLTGKKKGSDEIAVVVDLDGTGAVTASQTFTVNVSENCTITSKLATDLILEVGKSRTINLATLFTTSAGCTSLEYTPPSSSFGFYSVTPSGKSSTSARTFKGLIKGDERGTFTVEDTVSGKTASVKKLIQVIQGCTITSTPFSSRSIQKGTTQNLNIAGGFTAKNCSTLTYSATSSKPAIATVSGFGSGDATGTLSGVDFGATVITVTATSGTTSESRSFTLTVPACTITSTAIANRSVQVGKAIAMNVVGSFTARNCGTLTYAVTPTKTATATASGYGSKWKSYSNECSRSLTGVAAGSTLITVTASSGGTTESRTFTLTVTAAPVCSITSAAISNRSVQVGKAIAMNVVGSFTARNCGTLTYAVTPTKTATATASGYGSNDGAGSLTGVAAGSTLITVTASSGGTTESRTFTLTVTAAPVCSITSAAISNRSVQVGKAIAMNVVGSFTARNCGTLTYAVTPTKTATATASGYGSNDGAGSLTGVAAGSTLITVTATSGGTTESRTFTLTVTAAPVCSITSTLPSSFSVGVGKTITINLSSYYSFSSGCPSTRSYFRIGGVGSLQVWYSLVSFNTSTGVVQIKGLKVTPANGIDLYLGARAGTGTLSTSKGAFTAIIVTGTTPPPVCPVGQVGTPPNCRTPVTRCPAGQVGTPPNCTTPPPPCRISGSVSNVTLTVGQGSKSVDAGFRYGSGTGLRTRAGSFTYSSGCTSPSSAYSLVCNSPSFFSINSRFATIGNFNLTPIKAGATNCTLRATQQGTTHSDSFRVTVGGGTPCTITSTLPSSFSVGVGKTKAISFSSYFRFSSGCPSTRSYSNSGRSATGGWFNWGYFNTSTGAARIDGKKRARLGDSISITAKAGSKTLRRTTKIIVTEVISDKYCGSTVTTATKRCTGTLVKVGSCFLCKMNATRVVTTSCVKYHMNTTCSGGGKGSPQRCTTTKGSCAHEKRVGRAKCPTGWRQHGNWTETSRGKRQGANNCGANDNWCTTGSHSFSGGPFSTSATGHPKAVNGIAASGVTNGVEWCVFHSEARKSRWSGRCQPDTYWTAVALVKKAGCIPN